MTSIIVYIHGLPGSDEEIAFLKCDSQIVHLQPFGLKNQQKKIETLSSFKIIAFSLGSMTALEIAAAYPQKVEELVLIAPATPLELGDFLDKMDGRYVFRAAQRSSLLFSMLTFGQGLMARFTPTYLMNKMFGESCKADVDLLEDASFRKSLQYGLKKSLVEQSSAYNEIMLRYVKPWSSILSNIECPVHIWHGTEDTWVPFEMSEVLANAIGSHVEIRPCRDLGHYSTLHYVMKQIIK